MSSLADQSSPVSKAAGPGGRRIDPISVVIIVVGAACFVILFFGWNGLCLPLGPLGRLGGRSVCSTDIGVVSGWAGFGVVAGLAVVSLVLWEVLSLTGGLALSNQEVERQVAAGLAGGNRGVHRAAGADAPDRPDGVRLGGPGARGRRVRPGGRSMAALPAGLNRHRAGCEVAA